MAVARYDITALVHNSRYMRERGVAEATVTARHVPHRRVQVLGTEVSTVDANPFLLISPQA